MKHIFKKVTCLVLGVLMAASVTVSVGAQNTDNTIYSEDFENYDSISSYEDLGWSTYSDASRLKFSLDSSDTNKRLKAGNGGWALTQIVSDEDMAGVRRYTISVDMEVESMSTSGNRNVGIYYNHKNTTTAKNEYDCGVVQIRERSGSLATAYEPDGKIALAHGTRKGNKNYQWINASYPAFLASDFGFELGKTSNLRVDVDLDANTGAFYFDGKLVSIVTDLSADTTTEGCVSLMFQGAVTYVDNISIERGINIKAIGHQRSVAADTSYGLRFVAAVDNVADYSAVGFDIVVKDANGDTVKSTSASGNTVYKTVNGNVNGMGKSYAASDYSYNYLFAVTLANIPTTLGKLTFTVTPYAIDKNDAKISYAPITFTYDGAELAA